VDLVHTVLVDRLHRSKGYAIWSIDSEMDGSGGLGCFTWPEQGFDAVAAIGNGESLLEKREKRARDLGFPRELLRKKEEGTVISPRHLAWIEMA